MRLDLVTPPTIEPVTLAEAKLFARIDDDTENALTTELITVARKYVEDVTGRQLITATWKYYLDDFPSSGSILMPKSPLATVTSVKYLDENGTEKTFSSAYYRVVTGGDPGYIELLPTQSWPSTYEVGNCVYVTYTCGYGATAATVPEGLKVAIKMLVAHWFGLGRDVAVLGATPAEVPKTVDLLLWQSRSGWMWWE